LLFVRAGQLGNNRLLFYPFYRKFGHYSMEL
jgi:hypothetical protein